MPVKVISKIVTARRSLTPINELKLSNCAPACVGWESKQPQPRGYKPEDTELHRPHNVPQAGTTLEQSMTLRFAAAEGIRGSRLKRCPEKCTVCHRCHPHMHEKVLVIEEDRA